MALTEDRKRELIAGFTAMLVEVVETQIALKQNPLSPAALERLKSKGQNQLSKYIRERQEEGREVQ